MTVLSKFLTIGLMKTGLMHGGFKVRVSGDSLDPKFSEFAVNTTHGEICGMIGRLREETEMYEKSVSVKTYSESTRIQRGKDMVLEKHRGTMNDVYKSLMKYSNKSLTKVYDEGGEEWSDWCDDLVIYLVYDTYLNNRAFPAAVSGSR